MMSKPRMTASSWPADWTVRPATLDDVKLAVDMFNARSRKFYGKNQSTREEMTAWWKSPRFDLAMNTRIVLDPALWFLAVDGEEIVGFSVCTGGIADDTTRGYVDGLCVRLAWRKRGIALALLHHSFGELHRRGKTAVELDMDSENLTGALRPYERAGMRVIRRTINYEKVLRDGQDLTTRKLAA